MLRKKRRSQQEHHTLSSAGSDNHDSGNNTYSDNDITIEISLGDNKSGTSKKLKIEINKEAVKVVNKVRKIVEFNKPK